MTSPTLLILAAGIGSRYGSLKQLDPIGPNGETIIDYSVFDAIQARFGKVVFVIRRNIEQEFRDTLMQKLSKHIEVEYVLQEIEKIPAGLAIHTERQKPWGTGHAVLMAKDIISEPFAVINADDFYGADAFRVMADFLQQAHEGEYAMVGYQLNKTLSEHGTVSRGVCNTDSNGFLLEITEHTKIAPTKDSIIYMDENDHAVAINPEAVVSMNFWGFTPRFFDHLERSFTEFIKENAQTITGELYIPTVVNQLISRGEASIQVLESNASWFGITYREDRNRAIEQLKKLISSGEYSDMRWIK
ncbi:MAG: sugar phosphate nucleotidyltransferase [Bacteroidales bacterium]|nr:sugar phosphate nucleotidyltransferase [Bacteroidales bacterium]MDZ4204066.1 sugar phosphate nucleotidyltransferase [Bacteroidales bacterium]